MKKLTAPIVEALTLYTIVHALMHILPIILALGITGNLIHTHEHGHGHILQDTILLTLVSHLALPFFTLYSTKFKYTQQLYQPTNLLHRH